MPVACVHVRFVRPLLGAALALGTLRTSRIEAQSSSVIVAHVRETVSGQPVADAQLRVLNRQLVARTDLQGEATLGRLASGTVELEIRRIGYVPARAEARLTGLDTLDLEILLERSFVALDTIRVQASGATLGLETFERRRERGMGHFLSPKELGALGTREFASSIAASIPGARAITGTDGISRYLISTRQRGRDALRARSDDDDRRTQGRLPPKSCVMHVYVDGVFLSDYDVSFIETQSIAAVEVYQADAPAELRRPGSDCGVVVLWTKRE